MDKATPGAGTNYLVPTSDAYHHGLAILDKTGWTIEVSSEQNDVGGGKNAMIDGNYSRSSYWHSDWRIGAKLPHWSIIDMQKEVLISRVSILRRSNPFGDNPEQGDTKTVEVHVSDNKVTWTKIGSILFSQFGSHFLSADLDIPTVERYIKLVLPDTYRDVHVSICEVDVYTPAGRKFETTNNASAQGWTVSVADAAYKVRVDFPSETVNGGIFTPWDNLYMIGGATEASWSKEQAIPLVRDAQNPNLFVFDGELKIRSQNVEPNVFKFLGQLDWDPKSLHPYVANEPIIGSKYVWANTEDDNKWIIDESQQGRYFIKVNLLLETIDAHFGEYNGIESVSVEAANDQLISIRYYNLNGIELRQPLKNSIVIEKKTYASGRTEVVKKVESANRVK
jgi:hypothetical protein